MFALRNASLEGFRHVGNWQKLQLELNLALFIHAQKSCSTVASTASDRGRQHGVIEQVEAAERHETQYFLPTVALVSPIWRAICMFVFPAALSLAYS
jgi:hypothetical protein